MKNARKIAAALCLSAVFTSASLSAVLAGEWKSLEGGEYWQKWYEEDDGTYPQNKWEMIGGKWYHFDEDGYLDVGMRVLDGNEYILMRSGAMETDRDFGIGYLGSDGIWHLKEVEPAVYEEMCRTWGIDIDQIMEDCEENEETSYTCSTAAFPMDTEGNPLGRIAMYGIQGAVLNHLNENRDGSSSVVTCNYSIDDENGTFTITILRTDVSLKPQG